MVIGFCVKTDGGVSYLACPFCYAHLCDAYGSGFHNTRESDAGSSSDDSQNRDDEVYSCLRSLAGSEYAQVTVGWDNMWVACSSFRELENSRVNGRAFGCLGDFRRLASDLAWEVPSGLVVVNLAKEKTLVFKDGQEPTAPGAYSALSYLRRCAALGLMVYGDGKIAFLENNWGPGWIRTTYRRLIRETVAGWGD